MCDTLAKKAAVRVDGRMAWDNGFSPSPAYPGEWSCAVDAVSDGLPLKPGAPDDHR